MCRNQRARQTRDRNKSTKDYTDSSALPCCAVLPPSLDFNRASYNYKKQSIMTPKQQHCFNTDFIFSLDLDFNRAKLQVAIYHNRQTAMLFLLISFFNTVLLLEETSHCYDRIR